MITWKNHIGPSRFFLALKILAWRASDIGRVRDFKDPVLDDWNLSLLEDSFSEDPIKAILNITWPNTPREDKLLWKGNKSGAFSVEDVSLEN